MKLEEKLVGVILGGGKGTRLWPDTGNKHLGRVYCMPMIMFPILNLVRAGIRQINLVVGDFPGHLTGYEILLGRHGERLPDVILQVIDNQPATRGWFEQILGQNWAEVLSEVQISYCTQPSAGGLSAALACARDACRGYERIIMHLGDNLVWDCDIRDLVEAFLSQPANEARVVLYQVTDPERFGVAEKKDDRIVDIQEKPSKPVSDLAVTGIYCYPADVFDRITTLEPSQRGELEITSLNNLYAADGLLSYSEFEHPWIDAGTFESLIVASLLAAEMMAHNANSIMQDFDILWP